MTDINKLTPGVVFNLGGREVVVRIDPFKLLGVAEFGFCSYCCLSSGWCGDRLTEIHGKGRATCDGTLYYEYKEEI